LGAAYARLKPSLPGPAGLRGLLLGLSEHVVTWPMTALVDRYHPAPQGVAEPRRQPPSLRPGDDPPRSVRDRPRAPRGRTERPQRIAHVVARGAPRFHARAGHAAHASTGSRRGRRWMRAAGSGELLETSNNNRKECH